MKSMKEIIIGSMENGPEVMSEIAFSRKNKRDFTAERGLTNEIIKNYHPGKLDLIVTEVREATKEARIIRFAAARGRLPVFEAGQYINIFTEIDGVRTSRPYSISSSPFQRAYYEICVAAIKTGFVSDYLIDKVKVGDRFEANGPQGVFHYNPVFHHRSSVFLAGGSGITPFMSMAREALDSGADREITLIYGARTKELAIYHDELADMSAGHKNFSYHLVLSDDESEKAFRKGFINGTCISELAGDLSEKTFYLCGPPVMTDFCSNELSELGVNPRNIRREMFGARQDIENEPGWPSGFSGNEVFKLRVGEKVIGAKSSESVLTALERAGIRVNVCCRSGECSLCRVKLVDGKVFMPRGVLLRHADEKFGYIHSCKAYPISDLEIAF